MTGSAVTIMESTRHFGSFYRQSSSASSPLVGAAILSRDMRARNASGSPRETLPPVVVDFPIEDDLHGLTRRRRRLGRIGGNVQRSRRQGRNIDTPTIAPSERRQQFRRPPCMGAE